MRSRLIILLLCYSLSGAAQSNSRPVMLSAFETSAARVPAGTAATYIDFPLEQLSPGDGRGANSASNAMIADETAAKSISDLMLDIGRRLDQSVVNIRASTSDEEFRIYRRAVGAILGEILLGVLNPLYARHPSLKPPELN